MWFTCNTGQQITGSLRLVGNAGTESGQGRLEIYLNRQWGTVCESSFGAADAILACNQLGYKTYSDFGTVGDLRYVLQTCLVMVLNWGQPERPTLTVKLGAISVYYGERGQAAA